jgi:hypothetical protein
MDIRGTNTSGLQTQVITPKILKLPLLGRRGRSGDYQTLILVCACVCVRERKTLILVCACVRERKKEKRRERVYVNDFGNTFAKINK